MKIYAVYLKGFDALSLYAIELAYNMITFSFIDWNAFFVISFYLTSVMLTNSLSSLSLHPPPSIAAIH